MAFFQGQGGMFSPTTPSGSVGFPGAPSFGFGTPQQPSQGQGQQGINPFAGGVIPSGMFGQPQQQQPRDPSGGTGTQIPPLPSSQYTDRFIPPVLLNPFMGGINAAAQMGGFASQAAPMAGMFQQGLYSPGLNPMEQAFLGSSGALGMRGLESAFNRIDAQYENAPMASTRFRQMTDAGNQFGEQMANIGSQMGLQRMSMAAQNLPFAFGFPLQAADAGQTSAADLLNLANQAMTGPLDLPLSIYQSAPVIPPAVIQPPATAGGKK